MDYFTGFNNLAPSIKSILLVLLIKMPFWYLAIVIFSGSFAAQHPFYIHLVAAFCLTIAWLVGIVMTALSIEGVIYRDNHSKGYNGDFYEFATVLTLPILCLCTFLNYISNWHFMRFLYLTFGFLAILFFAGLMGQLVIYLLTKIKKSK